MIKVKYLNDEKRINLPDKLEQFKKQVRSLFKINSESEFNIISKKNDFECNINNEDDYICFVKELIQTDIYILIDSKIDLKKYLNFAKSNSQKIDDLEIKINFLNNEIKNMSIELSKNPKKSNSFNKINMYKQKKNFFLEERNLLDKKINSKYIADFLNNNASRTVLYKNIMNSNNETPNNQRQPIDFTLYISDGNNQNIKWPDDTILKCLNDNTDIFFYHCKWKKNSTYFNGNQCYSFNIIFNFKTKKIEPGVYSCRYFLTSDSKGRIGNTYGQVFVEVINDFDEMGENDSVFMNKYKPKSGSIEFGQI